MINMVYPPKGESRYIAFDHSPPTIYLNEREVSAIGNYAIHVRSFL